MAFCPGRSVRCRARDAATRGCGESVAQVRGWSEPRKDTGVRGRTAWGAGLLQTADRHGRPRKTGLGHAWLMPGPECVQQAEGISNAGTRRKCSTSAGLVRSTEGHGRTAWGAGLGKARAPAGAQSAGGNCTSERERVGPGTQVESICCLLPSETTAAMRRRGGGCYGILITAIIAQLFGYVKGGGDTRFGQFRW